MIASLMMYDRPELSQAHARYWALIRTHLADAGLDSPPALSQQAEEFSVWTDPALVLSQTCGMPYRLHLHGQVALVGTPDYGVAGCPPGYYCSALVVRADDPRDTAQAFKDATFAYNQTISQSGYAAPYNRFAPCGFWFENTLQTGAHVASARAVATGQADIASLDAVTWRLLGAYEDFASDLRVLEMTAPTPGLPLITSRSRDPELIFGAVECAIRDLSDDDRTLLGLQGIVRIPADAYLAIPSPP